MKQLQLFIAACAAASISLSSHAANFDFSQAFGGYHKYLEFTEDDIDLRVDPVSGGKVSQNYFGLGRGSWFGNAALSKKEKLTFSFDQTVDLGSIVLNAWGRTKISWTYADGSTGKMKANARWGGLETQLNLSGITSLTVAGKKGWIMVGGFNDVFATSEVPVPAAAWLFGSALLGLGGACRRR